MIEDITILYDSVYLPQLDEWYVYEFGADTTFSYTCQTQFLECGDPVNYQGYDYATVLIGEDCWFAENLKCENYRNGDSIPSHLSDEEWRFSEAGAVSFYGQHDLPCTDASMGINACDSAVAIAVYGRLYNGLAVRDERKLCPAGWEVSNTSQWESLEAAITDGIQLMSSQYWNGLQGLDVYGFDGRPGGYRDADGGGSNQYGEDAGMIGAWWFIDAYDATHQEVGVLGQSFNSHPNFYIDYAEFEFGLSVRCVKTDSQ